ncbi:putative mitochondrial glutathione peroxidase-like protein [Leptomonas pyrrhocoris]|uniref:Glutathione peroxidase n=1 Tax=Leptomonas pyrrhocoris TaxID=157538 RepID=A0A0M9GBL0_LEPPY|nr:putative mitochondrial glutathione peroxidase-like protein [Leptomonas pyrrhocoris]KPA86806.1 putative mitochondrial glutathione peroxidase-like protein [Leptomonas pyrrhocoris]|eukprot:XP_015665245.1 putative mitochondrial glutathione peroxidase-like protein [Leptomonas pyrrhocoris]
MEARNRVSISILEASAPALSRSQHLPSANNGGVNNSTSQGKAPNETLASNEPSPNSSDPNANKTIFDFQVLNCFHELYDLAQHKGSVVLICNVASKDKDFTEAGYTTLSKLYHKHHAEGFVVLAFPCNEFGSGEPGNEDEIAENISCLYPRIGEVDFPIMAKVEVNGDHASPLFTFLKSRIRGTLGQTAINWNFTVFVCDQAGVPFARFAPEASMAEIDARIDELLHPRPPPAPVVPAEPLAPLPADAQQQPPPTKAVVSVGEIAVVEDSPTPNDFSGRATPPPSVVAQHNAHETSPAAKATAAAPSAAPRLQVSAITVTDVTSRGSPPKDEDTGSPVASELSSTLLCKTTGTLEGADF